MKYNWKTMTDEKKDMAIRDELTLVTHMGTTKDDFIEIMRYQSEKLARQPRFSDAEREALESACKYLDGIYLWGGERAKASATVRAMLKGESQ